jgi:hypothetical protein
MDMDPGQGHGIGRKENGSGQQNGQQRLWFHRYRLHSFPERGRSPEGQGLSFWIGK